jgi:energy-coupling factor transporter transmembrane protein EcfT
MKMERLLTGCCAVFVFAALVFAVLFVIPRWSIVIFSFIAAPIIFVSFFAQWRRLLVGCCTLVVIVIFAATPVDITISRHEEKKGVYFLPVVYGIGGGIEAGYYSPGCMPSRDVWYQPKHVVLLSI